MSADDFQEVEGTAPAATYAAEPQPQMAMGPSGPQPADPRLYRFFWCAMACAIGVLFPFTSSHPEWKADTFNRARMGPSGTDTFFGALIGFFSVLTAAQYWWCMKYRKVKLWPLILMVIGLPRSCIRVVGRRCRPGLVRGLSPRYPRRP